MSELSVLVIGQGEVGGPLADILDAKYRTFTKDVEPLVLREPIDVMHVCYQTPPDVFVETTVKYIGDYKPNLTIIHSTVVPGTTRAVYSSANTPIAYSAVRGKHTTMREHLLSYTKFVGGVTPKMTTAAMEHLKVAGFKVDSFSSPEALELAKLVETTYFGLLIAWAQEMDRFCKRLGVDYHEVLRVTEEIDFLPPVVFQPGFIGGHCVMPNTYLLEQLQSSLFIDTIRQSNDLKRNQWLEDGIALNTPMPPIKPN